MYDINTHSHRHTDTQTHRHPHTHTHTHTERERERERERQRDSRPESSASVHHPAIVCEYLLGNRVAIHSHCINSRVMITQLILRGVNLD